MGSGVLLTDFVGTAEIQRRIFSARPGVRTTFHLREQKKRGTEKDVRVSSLSLFISPPPLNYHGLWAGRYGVYHGTIQQIDGYPRLDRWSTTIEYPFRLLSCTPCTCSVRCVFPLSATLLYLLYASSSARDIPGEQRLSFYRFSLSGSSDARWKAGERGADVRVPTNGRHTIRRRRRPLSPFERAECVHTFLSL